MGTMIQLSLGNLEIDWGKNSGYRDHSVLFQKDDIAQVPTYYASTDSEELANSDSGFITVIEYKTGLSKCLWQVAERIELLGYTFNYCHQEFEYLSSYYQSSDDGNNNPITFEQLKNALATMDLSMISLENGNYDWNGKSFKIELFNKMGIGHLAEVNPFILDNVGEGYDLLSPYSILKLISNNPLATQLPVIWDFADHEAAGYGTRNDYVKIPDQSNRFLIVTEGSSDALIIKHAFALLKPHIADFFDFVDMHEGYPFSGTGSLVNFVKGLISIKVQNNIIVLFDNDAEGVYSYNRCQALNVPSNIRILKLPDVSEFKNFPTSGPNGMHKADINGKAAAIECYLELDSNSIVRWNNFNQHINEYQGELIGKEQYKNSFLEHQFKQNNYNYSKILAVLEIIISNCSLMTEIYRIGEAKSLIND